MEVRIAGPAGPARACIGGPSGPYYRGPQATMRSDGVPHTTTTDSFWQKKKNESEGQPNPSQRGLTAAIIAIARAGRIVLLYFGFGRHSCS